MTYTSYITHGVSIDEYITRAGGLIPAAKQLHEYIIGEAADECALYDPEAAVAMRSTSYMDVFRDLARA
jgi:hypothetical protein